MKKIKLIKKIKALFIRLKLHVLFKPMAELFIYTGYLIKLSSWIEVNKEGLVYNDFFNKKVIHSDRIKLYEHLLTIKKWKETPLSYLEFGVAGGSSLRWWVSHNENPDSDFWGFDTFTGLPEVFGTYKAGTFSQKGIFPDIKDTRIKWVKGLFQDTLLTTIPKVDFNRHLLIHMDADLYTATIYTLSMLYPYLKSGDIIIFDEFGVPGHEFKAFDDFTKSFPVKLKPLGAINNYLQMVFEVKKPVRNEAI